MFSYHARRRNLSQRQPVYSALFCQPDSASCEPMHVSKAFLGHLRGKRARSVQVNGDKRILVDSGRTRVTAAANEVAARYLAGGQPSAKPISVRGPAWLLLKEESWFCLWHRLTDGNDLRGRIERLARGKYICETVRLPDDGDIAVWQRWLFCDEDDFLNASNLSGMQPCDEGPDPPKSVSIETRGSA